MTPIIFQSKHFKNKTNQSNLSLPHCWKSLSCSDMSVHNWKGNHWDSTDSRQSFKCCSFTFIHAFHVQGSKFNCLVALRLAGGKRSMIMGHKLPLEMTQTEWFGMFPGFWRSARLKGSGVGRRPVLKLVSLVVVGVLEIQRWGITLRTALYFSVAGFKTKMSKVSSVASLNTVFMTHCIA